MCAWLNQFTPEDIWSFAIGELEPRRTIAFEQHLQECVEQTRIPVRGVPLIEEPEFDYFWRRDHLHFVEAVKAARLHPDEYRQAINRFRQGQHLTAQELALYFSNSTRDKMRFQIEVHLLICDECQKRIDERRREAGTAFLSNPNPNVLFRELINLFPD